MSNSTKKELLRQQFAEWSLLSTFHCYPKIFQYKNVCAKIIWTTLFATFTCMTVWLVVNGLLGYFDFEVVSKIRVYNEKVLLFPTVSICEANSFTTKAAEDLVTPEMVADENFFKNRDLDMHQMKPVDLAIIWMESLYFYSMNKLFYLNSTQKQASSFHIDDVLQSCYFNGMTCHSTDFAWFFSYNGATAISSTPKTKSKQNSSAAISVFPSRWVHS